MADNDNIITPSTILLTIIGLIFTIYGIILVASLTKPSVNSPEEIDSISVVLNVSKIISLVIVILLAIIVGVALAYPPILEKLMPMKVLYGTVFIAMLILTVISWLLHADVLDENPNYGVNVTGKDNIIAAKKDYLIRYGIVFTVIGFLSLGYVIFTVLKPSKKNGNQFKSLE